MAGVGAPHPARALLAIKGEGVHRFLLAPELLFECRAQPLGLLSLTTTRPPFNAEEAAEIEDFEERAGALVANAVAIALVSHDSGINENDRPICTQAALAANRRPALE